MCHRAGFITPLVARVYHSEMQRDCYRRAMSSHPAFIAMKDAWLANDATAKEASDAAEQALLDAQKHTQTATKAREAMFQLEQHAAKHGWMFFDQPQAERGGET